MTSSVMRMRWMAAVEGSVLTAGSRARMACTRGCAAGDVPNHLSLFGHPKTSGMQAGGALSRRIELPCPELGPPNTATTTPAAL